MGDETVDRHRFLLDSVSDKYNIQEMCDKIVSEDPFKFKHCHDRYETQGMCNNNVVDDFVSTLKFVPDWFVTSKMIKKLFTVLYTDDNILFLINIPHFFVTKWVFLL